MIALTGFRACRSCTPTGKVDMPIYKKSKEEKKWPRMQIVNQKEKKAPCVTTASVGDGGRPEPAEEVPLECVPLLSLFLSAHPSRLSLLRCCVADPTKCMHVMSTAKSRRSRTSRLKFTRKSSTGSSSAHSSWRSRGRKGRSRRWRRRSRSSKVGIAAI